MKNNTVYSTDGTNFNYNEIEDAIEDAFCCADESEQTTIIYQAEICEIKLSEFINKNLVEDILEESCNKFGEMAESWASNIDKKSGDLFNFIILAMDKWALDNGLQPDFFKVKTPEEITVNRPND